MKANNVEHVISTPSGMRVLTEIQPGTGFAVIRSGFAPEDMSNAAQRLHLNDAFDQVHTAADGTHVNRRHIWSLSVQWAKPNRPLNVDSVADHLFYPQIRPDLHKTLMKLFETFDPADPYWSAMSKHGYYNPETKTVHRVKKGN